MRRIVAIGGGNLRKRETWTIDQEVVRLAGKKRPRSLFLPTASGDSERYWEVFKRIYGDALGCRPDVLMLLTRPYEKAELRRKILSADLVYVGGGNTLAMMRRWRRLGVDRLLEAACRKGIVLSGLSAGAICWFAHGHSDSMRHYGHKPWAYIRVRGLGLINATVCPHYHGEKRERDFRRMILRRGGIGLALDDHCALEVIGGKYRVIRSKRQAMAYRFYKQDGRLIREVLEPSDVMLPCGTLLSKGTSSV